MRLCSSMRDVKGELMKPNIYYRSFYTLMTFYRRQPHHTVPSWPAVVFLSLCITANIYSAIMLLELAGAIGTDLSKWSLFVFLLVAAINYFLLVDGGRKESILRIYEKRRQGSGRSIKAGVATYAFFSFALVLYLAEITRNIFP